MWELYDELIENIPDDITVDDIDAVSIASHRAFFQSGEQMRMVKKNDHGMDKKGNDRL